MQAEFKPVYKKMLVEKLKRENDQKEKKEDHADTSDAAVDKEVDTAWNKMDGDGDGSLTVSELAKFYGFSLEEDKTNEMTDDQILEALQVRVPPPHARKEHAAWRVHRQRSCGGIAPHRARAPGSARCTGVSQGCVLLATHPRGVQRAACARAAPSPARVARPASPRHPHCLSLSADASDALRNV